MIAKVPYWKKLLDPRWQRKRLDILGRDDFKCRCCKAADSTLHVHHRYYLKGVEPWEYPDHSMVSVCADCHILLAEFEKLMFAAFPPEDMHHLTNFIITFHNARMAGLSINQLSELINNSTPKRKGGRHAIATVA